jgi:hypothetical protein
MKNLKHIKIYESWWDNHKELLDITKDYLNREIQFTVERYGISFYVLGTIKNIEYHSNGRGFIVILEKCKFGETRKLEKQSKEGSTNVVIFPNENRVLCDIGWDGGYSMWDVQHEIVGKDALNDFTLKFFNFMKKLDFSKAHDY